MRGKGSPCLGLTTLTRSCADCHEIWEPQPPETVRASPGLHRESFIYNFRSKSSRSIPNDISYRLVAFKIYIYSTISGR